MKRQLNNQEKHGLKTKLEVKGSKLTVGIYARKSRTDENDRSLETQIRECQEFIDLNNEYFDANKIKVYKEDEASGFSLNRIELKKLLSDVENKAVDVVMAVSLDRISRKYGDYRIIEDLITKNRGTILLVDNPLGISSDSRLSTSIEMVMNEFFIIKNLEYAARNQETAIKRVEYYVGKPPYGYMKKDKVLVKNPDEAPAVELIFKSVAKGISFPYIIKELEKKGYKTQKGSTTFSRSTISTMLENEKYYGKCVYNKNVSHDRLSKLIYEEIRNDDMIKEPIVTKELFELAQFVLSTKSNGRHSENRIFLLTGLLRAADNDNPLSGNSASSSNRRKSKYYFYQKSRGSKSKVKQKNAVELEKAVIDKLMPYIRDYIEKNNIQDTYLDEKIKKIEDGIKKINRYIKEREQNTSGLLDRLPTVNSEYMIKDITKKVEENAKEIKKLENQKRRNRRIIKKYEELRKVDLLKLDIDYTNPTIEMKILLSCLVEKIIVGVEDENEIKIVLKK